MFRAGGAQRGGAGGPRDAMIGTDVSGVIAATMAMTTPNASRGAAEHARAASGAVVPCMHPPVRIEQQSGADRSRCWVGVSPRMCSR